MDALMASLVTVLLANSDGRLARLMTTLIARHARTGPVLIAFACAAILNAVISAVGGTIANAAIGLGVLNLTLGIALLSAALAVAWFGRRPARTPHWPGGAWASSFLLLALLQFGDRGQFLIFSYGATVGAGWWAAVGGLIGLTLAVLPALLVGAQIHQHPAARWVRIAAALCLAFLGIRALLVAFGLV